MHCKGSEEDGARTWLIIWKKWMGGRMRLSWCGKVLLGVLVFLVLVNCFSVVLFPVGPGLLFISAVPPL